MDKKTFESEMQKLGFEWDNSVWANYELNFWCDNDILRVRDGYVHALEQAETLCKYFKYVVENEEKGNDFQLKQINRWSSFIEEIESSMDNDDIRELIENTKAAFTMVELVGAKGAKEEVRKE